MMGHLKIININGEIYKLIISFVKESITADIPELNIISNDGYFYYRMDMVTVPELSQLSMKWHSRISSIIEMFQHQFLKPAVLVLTGNNTDSKSNYSSIIQNYLLTIFGDKLKMIQLKATDDTDRETLFGNPSDPVLSGLFRWIDDISSPVHNRTDQYGLVILEANEMGQFMTRELIENSDSKTHRNSISKARILFLIILENDVKVSSQLYSRAHEVIYL